LNERSGSPGGNALHSAAVTAAAIVALNGAAAVSAIIFAHHFGRTPQTDGVSLALNVYLVLVLAAGALRVVVLPDLTRAAVEGGWERVATGYAVALALFTAVLLGLALVGAVLVAALVPGGTAHAFALSLPLFTLAGCLQLFAGLAASVLAAFGNYTIAAYGFMAAGVAGLAVFLATLSAGPIALALGLTVNASVAAAVPVVASLRRRGAAATGSLELRARFAQLGQGAALPLALQALYAITAPFALRHGPGAATTFLYAYTFAAFLVAVTATSLALISTASLTRRGVTAVEAARHIVETSWVSLAVIAAAVGVFALVGGKLVGALLGGAYSGEAGRQLGHVVVAFGPWMFFATALTVAFPLLFVLEKPRVLVPLAIALPIAQVPIAYVLGRFFGLEGLALSLAVTTGAALVVLVAALSRRALALVAAGLGRVAVVVLAIALIAFVVPSLVLGGIAAAVVGVAVYGVLLVLGRRLGFAQALAYARALH
jgi:peptidoglycan biosynthesis protein MviN/MurJ (putative lipid II flippase)